MVPSRKSRYFARRRMWAAGHSVHAHVLEMPVERVHPDACAYLSNYNSWPWGCAGSTSSRGLCMLDCTFDRSLAIACGCSHAGVWNSSSRWPVWVFSKICTYDSAYCRLLIDVVKWEIKSGGGCPSMNEQNLSMWIQNVHKCRKAARCSATCILGRCVTASHEPAVKWRNCKARFEKLCSMLQRNVDARQHKLLDIMTESRHSFLSWAVMLKRSISVFIQRSKDFIGLRSVCLFMPANDYKMDTCICAPMNGKGSVYSLCWLRWSSVYRKSSIGLCLERSTASCRRVCWSSKSLLGLEEFAGARRVSWGSIKSLAGGVSWGSKRKYFDHGQGTFCETAAFLLSTYSIQSSSFIWVRNARSRQINES